MRISPNPVQTGVVSKNQTNLKTTRTDSKASTDHPKKTQGSVSTGLINRQELLALAKNLKQGLIDKDQASAQFVDNVVKTSMKGNLSENDCQRIAQDISNLFAHDQEFVRKLEKNLRDLV